MLKARRISDNNKFIEKPPVKTIVIRLNPKQKDH